MQQIRIIKNSSNIQKCQICHGEGFIFQPSGGDKSLVYFEVCRCIEEACICDKKPPYMYFNEESRVLTDCSCKSTRVKISKIKSIIKNSNIPLKYQYKRLKDFIIDFHDENTSRNMAIAMDEAMHFVDSYAPKNPGKQKGMYLFGPPGTGKTMLASIIANELILRNQAEVNYAKISRDFFQRIRATFNSESSTYGKSDDILQKYASVDLLILDDFGVQADSEWEKRTLYDLIDARYENQCPVVITSNVIPEDWKNLFNGRIYSRLMEMTNFIDMIADDFRNHFTNKL